MMDVIVYGTGNYGQKFMQQCGKEHNVLFWVDGNKDKQGDVLFDREIKSPDVLKEYLNVGVVIAICNDLDIRLRLFEMGCKSIWKFLPDTGIVSLDGVLENNYIKTQPRYWGKTHSLLDMDAPYSCTSQLCNQQFFDMPFFHYWAKKFMPNFFDHLRLNSFMKTTDKTLSSPLFIIVNYGNGCIYPRRYMKEVCSVLKKKDWLSALEKNVHLICMHHTDVRF